MPEPSPAPQYTHGHHEAVLRSHRWRTAENSAAYLLPRLQPGLDLLDVGCGPGTITVDLAARVAPGRVVGIDPAIEAVSTPDEPSPNVTFATGDVYELAYANNSFDVVHAHQVLQHLAEPLVALREMRRVCRPDGVVAVRDSDYSAFTWHPADPRLTRWLELYTHVARANGGEPDAGRHLLAWSHAAGFSQVTPSASVWCFATPEDREWWGGLWADRITAPGSALAQRAAELGHDADELADMANAWRTWAAHPDGWFAVLHGEVLCLP
jgi:ubiquinone/menaquinone biosynthesis C-methylase UbiE